MLNYVLEFFGKNYEVNKNWNDQLAYKAIIYCWFRFCLYLLYPPIRMRR